MARFTWLDRDIYVLRLDKEEESQLAERANQSIAGSAYLTRIVQAGLALGERVQAKSNLDEDAKE